MPNSLIPQAPQRQCLLSFKYGVGAGKSQLGPEIGLMGEEADGYSGLYEVVYVCPCCWREQAAEPLSSARQEFV